MCPGPVFLGNRNSMNQPADIVRQALNDWSGCAGFFIDERNGHNLIAIEGEGITRLEREQEPGD